MTENQITKILNKYFYNSLEEAMEKKDKDLYDMLNVKDDLSYSPIGTNKKVNDFLSYLDALSFKFENDMESLKKVWDEQLEDRERKEYERLKEKFGK